MSPSKKTPQRAAVIGSPIEHSLSPALHRAAYAQLDLLDWEYSTVEVTENEFPAFLAGLDDSWRGLSITMPLKRAALAQADEATELAVATGAANTYSRTATGGWLADNTDVVGMVAALRGDAADNIQWGCVIGGGATAASALAALAELGCRTPTVYVRSSGRAKGLRRAARRIGVQPTIAPWESTWEVLSADLVISTVPTGAGDKLAEELATGDAPTAGPLLLDVVYDPWPTELATAWAARAGTVVGGFEMLLHQAVAQVRAHTGLDPDVETMRAAGLASLGRREDSQAGVSQMTEDA